MRKLTIKRNKSFVASLMKLKVYIEDQMANEININKFPCRKLGELKNGEEKSFEIDEAAAKVFVIVDDLSKEYCNDFYEISEGSEDVFLSGKNKFNPAVGNAFRFDDNNSAAVLRNRTKTKKRGAVVLVIAILIGAIAGLSISLNLFKNTPKPQQFFNDGMSITLTDDFKETSMPNFEICYDSSKVGVFVTKEEFSLIEGLESYSLAEYAVLSLESVNKSESDLKTDGGLTYFQYESGNEESNQIYSFFAYLFKTGDAFWIIQFATLDKNVEKYESNFVEWASSIRFDE